VRLCAEHCDGVTYRKAFDLTAREKELLNYLAKGYTYKEIGNKLFISEHTVRTHIHHIYEKLHVRNRAEALQKVSQKWS